MLNLPAALIAGKTVQQSFDIGQAAVTSAPDLPRSNGTNRMDEQSSPSHSHPMTVVHKNGVFGFYLLHIMFDSSVISLT
jgi:hypothetical protein